MKPLPPTFCCACFTTHAGACLRDRHEMAYAAWTKALDRELRKARGDWVPKLKKRTTGKRAQ